MLHSVGRIQGIVLLAALSAAASTVEAQDCPACAKAAPVQAGDTPFVGSPTGCDIPGAQSACSVASYNTNFFAFTPVQSGAYRISTCTGASNQQLTVLTLWSECSAFAEIACSFVGCPVNFGGLIGGVVLEQGVTYRIGVGSFGDPASFIESGVLSIDPIDPPGTGCSDAGVATMGVNPYDNSGTNEIVDLAGSCEPFPQGGGYDSRIYNAQYFRFTPPATMVYTISTCEQDEQIWERLAVLSDCSPQRGVLACSNMGCDSQTDYTGATIVGVELEAGVEYTIVVGGVSAGQFGAGAFTIAPFSPCPAPKPTVVELEPCGDDTNSGCLGSPGSAQPIELGDSVRGTMWAANGVRDTDWYALELSEGTEVTLELDSNFLGIATYFFSNCTTNLFVDQAIGTCSALTDGDCLPAGLYYIVVVPADFFGYPCGYGGGNDYTLTVTGRPCDASPPPNDLCADATVVSEGATPFDNFFASNDVDFATCALIGRDVWFAYTATEAGNHEISVCNGIVPFNSGMDIWSDCPELGGQVLACNTDASQPACGNSAFSAVVLPLAAGQTVLIRVGSEFFFDLLPPGEAELVVTFLGDEVICGVPEAGTCCEAKETPFCSDIDCCNFVCILDPSCCSEAWDRVCAAQTVIYCYDSCGLPPANDDCSDAAEATVGANAFRNARAEDSTVTQCGSLRFDVWYSYEAISDQPVSVSFCEEDGGWALISGGNSGPLDTRIAVFDSCGGSIVACSDNACGTAAKVTFTPACGATYIIGIGSNPIEESIYGQGIGSFVISQAGSCKGGCDADLNGDGAVGAQDLAALLSAWGGAAGDLNGDGTTNAQDLAALLDAWGPCAP